VLFNLHDFTACSIFKDCTMILSIRERLNWPVEAEDAAVAEEEVEVGGTITNNPSINSSKDRVMGVTPTTPTTGIITMANHNLHLLPHHHRCHSTTLIKRKQLRHTTSSATTVVRRATFPNIARCQKICLALLGPNPHRSNVLKIYSQVLSLV